MIKVTLFINEYSFTKEATINMVYSELPCRLVEYTIYAALLILIRA